MNFYARSELIPHHLGAGFSHSEQTDPIATGMTPVVFEGCFGWLHATPDNQGAETAVLLCPALLRDALDSHHAMRVLADAFAAAGYPAMRFDYPGIGDSCDPAGEPWAAWQRSVHDAVDWLRRTTGAQRVVFCGLRFGATLAALAAASRTDAAGLIMLAPVLRGHSYMRQLQIEAQMQNGASAVGKGLVFHELDLSAESVVEIGRADLQKIRLPAGLPIATFSQSTSGLLTRCVQAWTQSGATVTTAGFDGLEPMLLHNLVQELPSPDFSGVTDWLRSVVPVQPGPALPPPDEAVLHPPGCIETPLRFGPGGRLFGMLCRPDHGACDRVVLIGNTGRDPHYGFGRFAVEFARYLAAEGIASLRMDFAGLGDSIGPDGKETASTHMFEVDRTPDIVAALDALEQEGFSRFVVHGICAGAYHGLYAALADARIETLLLLNLPVFTWTVGDTVDFVAQKTAAPTHFLANIRHKAWWGRLLRGEVPFGTILRAQTQRQWQRTRAACLHHAWRLGVTRYQTTAQHALTTLSARGVRTLFLFAPDDGGVDAFEQEFGPGGIRMRGVEGVTMELAPSLDHQLSTAFMRRSASDRMLAFLPKSRYPMATARPHHLETASC